METFFEKVVGLEDLYKRSFTAVPPSQAAGPPPQAAPPPQAPPAGMMPPQAAPAPQAAPQPSQEGQVIEEVRSLLIGLERRLETVESRQEMLEELRKERERAIRGETSLAE